MTPIPGDIDGDDFVGINDLSFILQNWNKRREDIGFDPIADLDQDGFIGLADLNLVLSNWNKRREATPDSIPPSPDSINPK